MRKIPLKLRNELAADPYYKRCARADHWGCRGRITWEHAFIYAGKQINERWAIIPLCIEHHFGKRFDKRINQYIALQRATDQDLAKYPKVNWSTLKKSLTHEYGKRKPDDLWAYPQ